MKENNGQQLSLDFSQAKEQNPIIVFTDGASRGNPGPSGIGIVLTINGKKKKYKKYIGNGTNNIAELNAVKEAISLLLPFRDRKIVIYTDSSYVIGVLTKNWKLKANKELITEIKQKLALFFDLELKKVEAHLGIGDNETAHQLANEAIKEAT